MRGGKVDWGLVSGSEGGGAKGTCGAAAAATAVDMAIDLVWEYTKTNDEVRTELAENARRLSTWHSTHQPRLCCSRVGVQYL